MKNRKHFDQISAGFYTMLSIANATTAAQLLKKRKYGWAVYRMVLSTLLAGYAASAAQSALEQQPVFVTKEI